jgi:hypothetical protein
MTSGFIVSEWKTYYRNTTSEKMTNVLMVSNLYRLNEKKFSNQGFSRLDNLLRLYLPIFSPPYQGVEVKEKTRVAARLVSTSIDGVSFIGLLFIL